MPIVTLIPSLDSGMGSGSPTASRNDATNLRLGELASTTGRNRVTLLFDLSPVPANATILAAVLRLWDYNKDASQGDTIIAYRLKRNWTGDVNWNTYDGTHSWQTAGAMGANDIEQVVCGSGPITNEILNDYRDITMDAASLQEMVSGSWVNRGWLLKTQNENNDLHYFYSKEGASGAYPPLLVVEYFSVSRQFQAVILD